MNQQTEVRFGECECRVQQPDRRLHCQTPVTSAVGDSASDIGRNVRRQQTVQQTYKWKPCVLRYRRQEEV